MIEFDSVSKTYRDGTQAVRDLSLQIPSDKITVIVGPSGCGKTTTLRMLNRMLEPTKGKILWDGNPLRSRRKTTLRRQMGYVIQNGGLFPHRTVVENVMTVPGLLGWDKSKSKKRALELLKAVGLDPKLNNRYPAQLSGGQQQRVGVARALAADPIVLLMDEPFSALDPVIRNDLHGLLLNLQSELSKTIVMITHDIDEAIKLGDQVAILRVGGQLAQVGPPLELLDNPADDFVNGFVGKDRGYRALSFAPADGLALDRVKVVRDPSSSVGDEPVLVVDSEARPIGWIDKNRPGQVLQLGATFDPETDTMRVALDSALTSPVGLAVAVSKETGRYAGTVTAAKILAQVTRSRADVADEISGRQQAELTTSDESASDPSDGASEPGNGGESDATASPWADPSRNQADAGDHEVAEDVQEGEMTGADMTSAEQNDQVEALPDPTTSESSTSDSSTSDSSTSDQPDAAEDETAVRAPVEESAVRADDQQQQSAEELLREDAHDGERAREGDPA